MRSAPTLCRLLGCHPQICAVLHSAARHKLQPQQSASQARSTRAPPHTAVSCIVKPDPEQTANLIGMKGVLRTAARRIARASAPSPARRPSSALRACRRCCRSPSLRSRSCSKHRPAESGQGQVRVCRCRAGSQSDHPGPSWSEHDPLRSRWQKHPGPRWCSLPIAGMQAM